MSALPGYDAWKLASPPEPAICGCGDEYETNERGEPSCPSGCTVPCCAPNRCYCEDDRV